MSKVFEVITEHDHGLSKEILRMVQYVTCHDNKIKTVVDYFIKHCHEYEKELIGVKEVLTIVEHIEKPE